MMKKQEVGERWGRTRAHSAMAGDADVHVEGVARGSATPAPALSENSPPGEAKGGKGTAAPNKRCKSPAVGGSGDDGHRGPVGWAGWGRGHVLLPTHCPALLGAPASTNLGFPDSAASQTPINLEFKQNHPTGGGREPASAQRSRSRTEALFRVPRRSGHAAPMGGERSEASPPRLRPNVGGGLCPRGEHEVVRTCGWRKPCRKHERSA